MFDPQRPEDDLDQVLGSVQIEPDAGFDQRLHARLRHLVETHEQEIQATRANHHRSKRPPNLMQRPESLRNNKGLSMNRNSWLIPVFSVVVLGCIGLVILLNFATQSAGPGVVVTSTPIPSQEAAPTVGGPAGVDACPTAVTGQQQYVHQTGGYCFLYPEGWTLEPGPGPYDVLLRGPFHDLEHTQEGETAMLFINLIAAPGAAAGITPAQYADEVLAKYPPDSGIARSDAEIGGLPAVLLDNIPEIGVTRQVVVVANDTLYSLEMAATAGDIVQQDADQAAALLSESITFFAVPPAIVIKAQDVCPQAGSATQLVIDRAAGYCLLLPISAERVFPDTPIFYFGPRLSGVPEGIEPRPSLGIGAPGFAGDQTPAQIAQQQGGGVITETTIAGFPAVIAEREGDVFSYRTAYVVANGRVYTLLTQPTDPAKFPEAVDPIEQVWTTALDSIAFFTPWD